MVNQKDWEPGMSLKETEVKSGIMLLLASMIVFIERTAACKRHL
jgi:hypothetical protein